MGCDGGPPTPRCPTAGPPHPPLHAFPAPRLADPPLSLVMGRGWWQVDSDGGVVVGIGAEGVSRMTLSGGKGLGRDGARRLADLLQQAPQLMLAELVLV